MTYDDRVIWESVIANAPEQTKLNGIAPNALAAKITFVQGASEKSIFVFPDNGGVLILWEDGTWEADICPFSD